MPVEFDNAIVGNITPCTLSLSPWDCDCELPPNGGTFTVNCVSDGVINQTTGAYYVWVTPDGTVEVPAPPAFAQFIACTPTIITLAVYTLGMEKTPTHLDAGVSKSAPPAKRLAKE